MVHKLLQTLGLKEEHWKILLLRPIKHFMEKIFDGQNLLILQIKRTKILGDLKVQCSFI